MGLSLNEGVHPGQTCHNMLLGLGEATVLEHEMDDGDVELHDAIGVQVLFGDEVLYQDGDVDEELLEGRIIEVGVQRGDLIVVVHGFNQTL